MHYRWHPWAGRAVLAQITNQSAWRCYLEGEDQSSGQLIPLWMLDEGACASLTLVKRPVVAWSSLQQLQRLVRTIRAEAQQPDASDPDVSQAAQGAER